MREEEQSSQERDRFMRSTTPRLSKSRSEYLPRRGDSSTMPVQIKESSGGLTKITTSNTMSFIAITFVAVCCFYGYIERVRPIHDDIILSRDDCINLFNKHECVPSRSNSKLCSDLNTCIHTPDVKQCIVTLKDEISQETQLEGIKEVIENIGLMLGGTTLGAYFAHVLRLRHKIKTFLTVIISLFVRFTKKSRNKY